VSTESAIDELKRTFGSSCTAKDDTGRRNLQTSVTTAKDWVADGKVSAVKD